MRSEGRRSVPRIHVWATGAALAALLALPVALDAQEPTGSLTGRITDEASGRPVNGAQVSIEGLAIGTQSDARGRYLMTGIPAGEYTVRVTFIGYRQLSETVTVTAGDPVTADFALPVSAVTLDEVVVTGTAGQVERRRLGTSVGSLDVSQVTEVAPVESFGQLLTGRIAGVRSVSTGGGVGASGDLRIRGVSSANLEQRPVVYIDGVRVNNDAEEWAGYSASNVDGGTCCAFAGGAGQDRLSDLNPDEIERIEILRGAAAATLYGSEASNGVIQIFTKRGRSNSPPSFSVNLSSGFNRHRANFDTKLYPEFSGPDGFQALDANETLIENGLITSVDVSAQGGGQDVTYFLSGGLSQEEGSIKPNEQTRGNLRLNLRWVPNDEWTLGVNSSYARNRINALQSGNNWMALLGNAILGNPKLASEDRPYGEPWIAVGDIREVEARSDASRWTGGITATYNPTNWFSNKLTLGMDHTDDQKTRYMPFGNFYVQLGTGGERNVGFQRTKNFTLDYLGQLNFGLTETVESDFSFGAQGYWETQETSIAWGQNFAGTGVTTVGGGANTFGDEVFQENVTVGVFAQNRFSFSDKFFTTVGARLDGHSAFGENFGLQFYPKVDVSYMASEDAWVPELFSSLRLRAAWGQAGLPPGAFDSFLTFEPNPVLNDVPGVLPDEPGNPDLEPEKTTEIEGGFDVGFFDDRLGAQFTYYYAETRDALLGISLPSSAGFLADQLQNVGEIRNTGWEVQVNATPVAGRNFRWTTTLTADQNENEIIDLGETAVDGELGVFREGYPVDGVWSRELVGYDAETNTHTRSDTTVYWGPPLPTFNASWGNTFNVGDFRIYGLFRAETGAVFNNGDRRFQVLQGAGDEYLSTLGPDGSATPATDSIVDWHSILSPIDERDHIRLQEVSVTYSVPESLTGRLGVGSTQVTLSGFNLHWWDDCNCLDPNGQYAGGDSFNFSSFLATPQPRRFLFSVRTRF